VTGLSRDWKAICLILPEIVFWNCIPNFLVQVEYFIQYQSSVQVRTISEKKNREVSSEDKSPRKMRLPIFDEKSRKNPKIMDLNFKKCCRL